MKTLEQTSGVFGRDPIATSIEDFLHREAARGHGELRINQETGGVRVSFGQISVQAEDYDIAFVRLARALLDDARFSKPLMELLRGPMLAAA